MKHSIIFLLLLFTCPLWVKAQGGGSTFADTINIHHYLKVHVSSVFDYEPALQFGYSYPLRDGRSRMQHELGYVTWNPLWQPWETGDISYRGVRVRSQYRYYYLTYAAMERSVARSEARRTQRTYAAFDVMYKYGRVEHESEVARLGGAYFETMDISTGKHVAALHVIVGREAELFAGSKTILDYYMGPGIRYKSLVSDPGDLDWEDRSPFFYDKLEWPVTLSFMMGVQLGFTVK